MDGRYGDAPEQAACAQQVLIRPNRSLSRRAMVWLVAAYTGLMLAIGLGFLHAGAWMVLPFAGIEALLIAAIFYFLVYRHVDDHEIIILDGENIGIVKKVAGTETRLDFQRYWTRVTVERDRWRSPRLILRSHGRAIEIASQLSEDARSALAGKLKEMMGSTAYS
ncbi:MAG: DUF2244 domain-containing protein [Acidiferrobacterales bacterium]